MTPKISNGCYILVHVWWKFKLSKESVLCFNHETYGLLVKVFSNKDNSGYYWFKSTNKKGINSQEIGPVKEENILGRVIFSFR